MLLHTHQSICPMPCTYWQPAVLLLALVFSAPLQAQSIDYPAFEELFGEPVTLSVTGSPQRASQVPATMEIITAEQLRRSGALDIAGVLRYVTGIDVQRRTNNGPDLAIRGYNQVFSPRLLVLVNGRQVYADHYGYMSWSSLPVEMAEIHHIEVVKGPNSALFGFNATAGVINIITKNPATDDLNFVEVRSGTQQHRQVSAAGTFALGDKGGLRISGGVRQNEDFSTAVSPTNAVARQDNERRSLRMDLHYLLSPNVNAELEASWTATDQTNLVPSYTLAFEEMVVKSLRGQLSADTRFGLSLLNAYGNWIDNEVFAPGFNLDTFDFILEPTPVADFKNHLSVLQLQQIFKPATNHVFRLSAEYREGRLNTTPVTGGVVEYEVQAGGAMWQWQMLPSLALTTALRKDRLQLGRRGSMPAGLALSNADWDRGVGKTSYNAGLVWEANADNTLRLSSARGVQLPNLFNLGGNLVAFPVPPQFQPPAVLYTTGLPTLRPIIVTNHELSWDRNLPALDSKLRVALFTGESSNLIANAAVSDFPNAIFSAPGNIGDSRTSGYEVSLKGTYGDSWHWNLGYLHQDVDDKIGAEFPVWLTMVDFENTTARHTLNASLGWTHGAWEIDGFLRYQSANGGIRSDENFMFDPNDPFAIPDVLVRLGSFTTVDARIGYRFSDRMNLALSGQNLLESEQIQTAGPAVERRVFATFSYSF
jgi:outer membrane receptor for ferrienterochelin and colicins